MLMLAMGVCLHSALCNLEEQLLELYGCKVCGNQVNWTQVIKAGMLNVLCPIEMHIRHGIVVQGIRNTLGVCHYKVLC